MGTIFDESTALSDFLGESANSCYVWTFSSGLVLTGERFERLTEFEPRKKV